MNTRDRLIQIGFDMSDWADPYAAAGDIADAILDEFIVLQKCTPQRSSYDE